MPEKYNKPWRLREFLETNAIEHNLSLSWKFRIGLMERISKILSDLHRKNRAYGYGNLSSGSVFIKATDQYGLKALDTYPSLLQNQMPDTGSSEFPDMDTKISRMSKNEEGNETDLSKLDQLCLGVLLLEVLLEKPLVGKDLPHLVSLLRRKGLGNIKIVQERGDQKFLTPISKVKDSELLGKDAEKQKLQSDYVMKQLIKEELHRTNYNLETSVTEGPEKAGQPATTGATGGAQAAPKETRRSVKQSSGYNQIFNKSKRGKKSATTQVMSDFVANARNRISKIVSIGRNSVAKKSMLSFTSPSTSREPENYDKSQKTRNLEHERQVTEQIIEQAMDEEVNTSTGAQAKQNYTVEAQDEYVLADIIKGEVKKYLKQEVITIGNVEKPNWLLNLEELILNLLTSVDDSRPTSRVARNWMVEVLQSFEQSLVKHNEVKKLIKDPGFVGLDVNSKQDMIKFSETMKRGDYFQHIHLYEIYYRDRPIENILEDVEVLKVDIMVYHSRDFKGERNRNGEDEDEDDNQSLDSTIPPQKTAKDYEEVTQRKNPTLATLKDTNHAASLFDIFGDSTKVSETPESFQVPSSPGGGKSIKEGPPTGDPASIQDGRLKNFMMQAKAGGGEQGSSFLLPYGGGVSGGGNSSFNLDDLLEKDPPPIIGPKADQILDIMDQERRAIGNIMKPKQVCKLFDEQKRMPHQEVVNLLKKAKDIMDKKTNIIHIDAPVIVIGDIHGQYFDLRQVMKFCGKPKRKQPMSNAKNSNLGSGSNRRETVPSSVSRASKASKPTRLLAKRISQAARFGRSKNNPSSQFSRTPREEDKLVFNREEFIAEFDEHKKEAEAYEKVKQNDISKSRKTKRKSKNVLHQLAGVSPTGNSQILTKTLTLGRELQDFEAIKQSLEKSEQPRVSVTSLGSETKSAFDGRSPKDDEKGKTFLFLGDYIDRGSWSCEVLFYLLSLLVEYPESVLLLRGNHECDAMAETYGFRDECEHKYGREIYHRCVQVFNVLPIACVIHLPNNRKFLACHGGLSDKITSLDQIAKLERRREPGIEGVLCDLLWSDPVPNDVVELHNLQTPFEKIDYINNETRGCAKKFGYKALEKFLNDNDLVGIIRAHEAKEEGFQYHFQHAGSKNHICITVFSAPNYMNEHGNKGAVLIIHQSVKDRLIHQMKRLKYKYSVEQVLKQQDKLKDDYLDLLEPICYHEVHQPEVVAFDHENWNIVKQIEDTCPYMPTNIDEFYNSSLDILERYGDAQEQIATYKREQEARAQQIKIELQETKAEEAKLRSRNKKSSYKGSMKNMTMRKMKTLRKSVRTLKPGVTGEGGAGNGSGLTRGQVSLRGFYSATSQSSVKRVNMEQLKHNQFSRSMKRVKETHPQVMQEKLRLASSKLEKMEKEALRGGKVKALYDDDVDVFMKSNQGILSADNIATMKRGRAISQGTSVKEAQKMVETMKLMKKKGGKGGESGLSEAEEDNRAVIGQISTRSFMKRERVEIDFKDEWELLIASWLSSICESEVRPETLCEFLTDCSLLCKTASIVADEPGLKYYKRKINVELSAFEIRRNLIVFQDICKKLKIRYMFLILDIKDEELNYVLPPLIEMAKIAKKKGLLKLAYQVQFPEHLFNEELYADVVPGKEEAADGDKKEDRNSDKWRTKGLQVGNVTFNGEERLMLQLLFLMIDRDDTGFLQIEAIITWAKEEGKFIRPNHAKKVISAIDYDNDGAIGLRDFFQYAAKLKEEFMSEEYDDEEYDDYDTADEDADNQGEEQLFFEQSHGVYDNGDGFSGVALNDVNIEEDVSSDDSSEYVDAEIYKE